MPTSYGLDTCRCSFVNGTVVVFPSLDAFRCSSFDTEFNSRAVSLDGDVLSAFGTVVDSSIWLPDGRFNRFGALRHFYIYLYIDCKACLCYYSIACPTLEPKLSDSIVDRYVFDGCHNGGLTSVTSNKQFNITPDDIELLKSVCPSPAPYLFFAFWRPDPGIVTTNLGLISVSESDHVYIDGVECSLSDVTFCGFGNILDTWALPRHWSTAMLALCHTLSLYRKSIRFMLLDLDSMSNGTTKECFPSALIYEVLFGDAPTIAGDIVMNYGYHVNPEMSINPSKDHEHIYDFSGAIDDNSAERVDAMLRLQMMTWRVVPELRPRAILDLCVCIIGVGSLGCHLVRQLLAWGVAKFILIDHGRVSNSTRQCLYSSACATQKLWKTDAAASEIIRIRPDATVIPVNLKVPMPGHSDSEADVERNYCELRTRMLSSDVVFLATDSRESRWLPSLIGAACWDSSSDVKNVNTDPASRRPLIISAGVSFDSYMVVRHGYGSFNGGCYFCSDVQPPNDTISGRPMDETCTLVKPGAVSMCASASTELLVSLLQHRDGFQAQHDAQSCLGGLPHGIHMTLSGSYFAAAYNVLLQICQ
uniref:THIF-type NAD/FAD binding fold domain-containing protein n=1 Tax=Babesia bovis TaxID=5865 RepID=A7ARK2_BABBO|eukprot:XP_001610739.1 hypothetical protein [Babesia bovis T2Bo]